MKLKKMLALLMCTVMALSSIVTVGASDDMDLSVTDAEYIPVELEVAEEIVPDFESEGISENSGMMPRASVHSFSTKTLENSKPSNMTLTMRDLVWQTNATFTISGTCTKPTAKLSFELYRKVDGEWIRVARKTGVSCTSNGSFEWSTSYGADGDYGLKVWHNLDADDVVKITGNLIY